MLPSLRPGHGLLVHGIQGIFSMKTDVLITELCTEIDQLRAEIQELTERNVYWREKYINALKYNTKTDKPTVKVDLVDPELNKFMTDFLL